MVLHDRLKWTKYFIFAALLAISFYSMPLAEKLAEIPAPTHVDGTGRLQTVSAQQNPRYHRLIGEFERLTGVPVVVNTSFNDNEPICCTPEEAVATFTRTKMDMLVLGNLFAEKRGSP